MPPSVDSMTEHCISTVLAFLVSVKQWRDPKMLASYPGPFEMGTKLRKCEPMQPITHYHAYQKYTECLQKPPYSVPAAPRWSLPLFLQMKYFCYKHLSVYLVTTIYMYAIIASFYIFYASSVALTILLLKKPSNSSRI